MRFCFILAFMALVFFARATNYPVNVVTWSNTNPAFDTTVYVDWGDSLTFINASPSFAGFNIYVNQAYTGNSGGIAIGDTILVHPVALSDTVILLYVQTQVPTYGLRCHLHFLNMSAAGMAKSDFIFNQRGSFFETSFEQAGTLQFFDMAGRKISEQTLHASGQSTTDMRSWPSGIYFVRFVSGETTIALKKIFLLNSEN